MGMYGYVTAVSETTLDAMTEDPAQIFRVIDAPIAESLRQRGGSYAYRRELVPLLDDDGDQVELDESWHRIHAVLALGASEERLPTGLILSSDAVDFEGINTGYGAPRVLRAAQVKLAATKLCRIGKLGFFVRYLLSMPVLGVYPPGIGPLSFLEALLAFEDLKKLLRRAERRSQALVVHIG